MATQREEIRYEGGRGGKFQKRSGRRPHATPYDRPPTAPRNSTSNGWLSKLVDPAQKLITASAHMLFAPLFRKRLPPPPTPLSPPSREANDAMENKNLEAVATDPSGLQGAPSLEVAPSINTFTHGVAELEQILKEKTFTRSEIGRLTELLNSRVDVSSEVEETKSYQVPSTPFISHENKEESIKIPAQGGGGGTPMVSAPVPSPNVVEEDVASPAEIAKAYMGSRPSKVTPSIVASHSQTLMNNFTGISNPLKSSSLPLVPISSGNVDVIENGFVTPRYRGRSALARLTYSRDRTSPSIKVSANTAAITDAYRPTTGSSSQSGYEQRRLLAKEGALKRRSSVLEDEIGFASPSRRIRQKSNLLFSKGLSLPVSGSSTSISATGVGSETAQHVQSINVQQLSPYAGKALYATEAKRNLPRVSAEYKNDTRHSTGFPSIPQRSREMASKILEQLDKLTPPKEKSSELKLLSVRNNSPTKLSTSMLHGPALRSLEHVDTSKYLENVQDTRLNFAQDFTSQKHEKIEKSSLLKLKGPQDGSLSNGDGIGTSERAKDAVSSIGVPVPSQKKWAFQMSAHEDFVDLDEEGYSNGVTMDKLAERRENVGGSSVDKQPSYTEATAAEKPQALIEVKPAVVKPSIDSEINNTAAQGKFDTSVTIEKNASSSFPASSPSTTSNAVGPDSTLTSEKIVPPGVPNSSAPIFGFGDKFASQKESTASVPTFAFGDKVAPADEQNAVPIKTSGDNASPAQLATVHTTFNFGDKVTFPMPVTATKENGNRNVVSPSKSASSLVSEKEIATVGSASIFKVEGSCSTPSFAVAKESISDKADNKNSTAVPEAGTVENVLSSSVSTSTSTPSIFPFSSFSGNSNLNNGSLASTPSFFSTPSSTISNSTTDQNSSIKPLFSAGTTSLSTSISMPSFSAAPIFKFESSTVSSTSASPVLAPTGVESLETKNKQEMPFGNLSGIPSSEASAKPSSVGSSVFQFGAAPAASDATKTSEAPTFGSGNVFAFGAPIASASSGAASSTQSMPTQFSSSSPSLGFAGNSTSSSGGSLFASSTPATNLFNSGTTFGLAASNSSQANSVSCSAGSSSCLFGSSWQPSTTSLLSTVPNSSASTGGFSGFSFGSSSSAASNNAPMLFGSSTTSASTSSVFSFTSAAATASSQPVFGNSNQAFAFGAASSVNNNDQASMVDIMAEDTVQTVVPTPVFGQQPLSPPPSSGFMFGSTVSLPANPFQFGSQQNVPTQQATPPFQASGSLDFNASAGGNFSLGTTADKSNRKYVKVKSKSRRK